MMTLHYYNEDCWMKLADMGLRSVLLLMSSVKAPDFH